MNRERLAEIIRQSIGNRIGIALGWLIGRQVARWMERDPRGFWLWFEEAERLRKARSEAPPS